MRKIPKVVIPTKFTPKNKDRIHPMRRFKGIMILLIACLITLCEVGVLLAQPASSIVTEGGQTAEYLVRDVFAGTTCENLFNIASTGDAAGIGYFENGSSSIGIERGIILSTGPIGHAMGPNTATNRSGNFQDSSGDPDLDILATNNVYDAVGLSFDFVPLDTIVAFRYVFASEEYCEFVGSAYNDVFGFFVSGPGLNGGFTANAQNAALIPGSDDFVAINSVNHQQNSSFFVRNERPQDAGACNLPSTIHPHLNDIEYDGYTTVLTATLRLIPCETYHIRLVVGDVGDGFFDSAVFLEAGSFDLGGAVDVSSHGPVDSTGVYEGCDDAFFRFTRLNEDMTVFPLPVHFNVIGGTAVEGDDFVSLPQMTTISPGQVYVDVPVSTLNDLLPEDIEYFDLALDIPCACYADTARLYVHPPPPLEWTLTDVYLCEGASQTITTGLSGGNPPYTYLWSTGATTSSITVQGTTVGSYSVTATDRCGHLISDSITVFMVPPPAAHLSGGDEICVGDTAWLSVVLDGASPFSIEYAIDGAAQPPLNNIVDSMYLLAATVGGTYTLLSVQDAACTGAVSGVGMIEQTVIDDGAQLTHINCYGGQDGSINVNPVGGVGPYQFQWSAGLPPLTQHQQLFAGTYDLTITDTEFCTGVYQYELREPDPLEAPQTDCEDMRNGTAAQLSAAGGVAPYRYQLAGQANWQNEQIFSNLMAGSTYDLSVQDANGCIQPFIWQMPFFGPHLVSLPEEIEVNLGESLVLDPTYAIPASLVDSLAWTPAQELDCADCPTPVLSTTTGGDYALYVEDIFGCSQYISFRVIVDTEIDVYIPNVFSPNGDFENDYFNALGNTNQVQKVALLQIYDRWGGLLYSDTDVPFNSVRHGWNGYQNAKPAEPGVYLYFMKLELSDGSHQQFAGDVLLLR